MQTNTDRYANLTLDQKYDILTTDFLERDGDTFVRIRQSGRIGWEDTLPQGSAYSAAILNPKSELELYKNATRLAEQTITAMDTPFKVKVRINPERNCTDSHSVYVATKPFDDKDLSLGQKLDTFLGATIHEGCHLLYTDFECHQDNTNRIIHDLHNVFEDERIERRLGEEKPGLANFLKATKYYYFDKFSREARKAEEANPLAALAAAMDPKADYLRRLFNAILCIVRYPAVLDPDDARQFADELLHVRDILTPFPDSTEQTYDCAEKVYELLKQYVQEPPMSMASVPGPSDEDSSNGDKPGKPSSEQTQKDDSQQGDAQPTTQNPSKKPGNNLDGESCSEGSDPRQDAEGQNGQQPANGSDKEDDSEEKTARGRQTTGGTGAGAGEPATHITRSDEDHSDEPQQGPQQAPRHAGEYHGCESVSDEEIRQMLKDIIEAIENAIDDPTKPGTANPLTKDKVSEAIKQDETIAQECEGDLEAGTLPESYVIRKKTRSKKLYYQSLGRVRRWIPVVAAALRSNGTDYQYTISGCRSGVLDTNRLAEARQGVQNVYVRRGEVKCDKVNVALVIDESGSMQGRREQLARDTAILINEAVGNLPYVNLFIYGYTNNYNNCELFPYREGRMPFDKYELASITAISGTPTAEAVIESSRRIRKASKEDTLLFIISDGNPNSGVMSVRKAVDLIQKDGFSVIGVSVSSSLPKDVLKKMYDKWIDMSDVQDLAREIGKTVKDTILKKAKRTVA